MATTKRTRKMRRKQQRMRKAVKPRRRKLPKSWEPPGQAHRDHNSYNSRGATKGWNWQEWLDPANKGCYWELIEGVHFSSKATFDVKLRELANAANMHMGLYLQDYTLHGYGSRRVYWLVNMGKRRKQQ